MYVMFSDDFWKPLVSKLSWTSFLLIMPLKDKNEMYYYSNQCINYNLSKRQLQEKIKSNEYGRLDKETRSKLINQEQTIVSDFIKIQYLLKTVIIISEYQKKLILEDMDNFLTELGDGFCYIKK